MKIHLLKIIFFSFFIFLVSCRGQKSSMPPILPIQNMVNQTTYGPQSKNDHYKDGRAYRTSVQDTVAYGEEKTNTRLYEGIEPNSTLEKPQWVKEFPVKLDRDFLITGQNKFNIYCTPCHGVSGYKDGLAKERANGPINPANLFDAARLNLPPGQIFHDISYGVNNWNMPGYSQQLNVQDRWAVVAYVRALQLSQNSPVPSKMKK